MAKEKTAARFCGLDVARRAPLFFIAGPCLLESQSLATEVAQHLADLCQKRKVACIFKGSFDKANRTAAHSARGGGLDAGLKILAEVKKQTGLPVVTDVHLPQQAAEAAACADVLQIPAFLCRQTDLLEACARTGKPLLIKKGQFLSPWQIKHAAEKARAAGASEIALCERGACFGYHNLVADMRGLAVMRNFGWPVVFDATHSAQMPGGNETTGGARPMAAVLARAAAAAGVAGIFAETHPNPARALSDSAVQLPLSQMAAFMDSVVNIDRAAKAGEFLEDELPD